MKTRLLILLAIFTLAGCDTERQSLSDAPIDSAYEQESNDANDEASFYATSSTVPMASRRTQELRVKRNAVVRRNNFRNTNIAIDSEWSWLERFSINGYWGMLHIVIVDIIRRWAGRE